MEVICALSAFRSFAGRRGLRRLLWQQLHSDRVERDAIIHDPESYGCTAGEWPGFYVYGFVYWQRRMYDKHGCGGELKLDGKRSLDSSFRFTNHPGNGYLHCYPHQPGHH
jgi:hypothetical protein